MKTNQPKRVISYNQPSPMNIIVYYVTRVLGLPIFTTTPLNIFDTYRWIQWLQSKNIPYPYKSLFSNGTLKSEFGEQVPDGISVSLSEKEVQQVETWLGWLAKQPKWNYQKIAHEFRHWIYS